MRLKSVPRRIPRGRSLTLAKLPSLSDCFLSYKMCLPTAADWPCASETVIQPLLSLPLSTSRNATSPLQLSS